MHKVLTPEEERRMKEAQERQRERERQQEPKSWPMSDGTRRPAERFEYQPPWKGWE